MDNLRDTGVISAENFRDRDGLIVILDEKEDK
jgi:hypothetical protein